MRGVNSNRRLFLGGLALAILCSLLLFPSTILAAPGAVNEYAKRYDPPAPAGSGPASILAELTPQGYIPTLLNCYNIPAGIFGYVTKAGIPASGVTIKLIHRITTSTHEEATTVTNGCGYYSFPNIPSVAEGSGQGYFARFNNSGIPNCLLQWETRVLTPYTINQIVNIGNFDIGDIALLYPTSADPALPLPITFHWAARTQSPSDSYIFYIIEYPGYAQKYKSPALGFTDNIQIKNSDLPSDMVSGKMYYWYVSILAPDGATGIVSQMQGVTFLIP